MLRLAIAGVVLASSAAFAGPPRSTAERLAFTHENPCPSTGQRRGACPGFEVDHIQPLCAGGPDKRENLQWLSVEDHRFKTRVDVRECRRNKPISAID